MPYKLLPYSCTYAADTRLGLCFPDLYLVIEGGDDERVITVPEGEDHERVITVPEGQTTVIVNEDGDEIIFNPGVSIDSGSGYITGTYLSSTSAHADHVIYDCMYILSD